MTFLRWLSTLFALLLLAALLLGVGLACAIHLARRPDYAAYVGDASLPVQEEPFLDRGRQCDILVYGDSTASIGIDPRVLTAELGLSACNISVTRPIVDDLGTLPLDAFLAHNPKPKYLVFQFGPELLYRGGNSWEHNPYATMVMLSRDVPLGKALPLMLRHPNEALQFEHFMLTGAIKHRPGLDPEKIYKAKTELHQQSGGLLTLFLPAQTACEAVPLTLRGPLDPSYVKDLRSRYEVAGTKVLFRASPIPACDVHLQQFQRDLGHLVEGNVEGMPVEMFTAGDRHPTLEGSREDSLRLARLIAAHR